MKQLTAKIVNRLKERKQVRNATGFSFAFADNLRYLNMTDWDNVTRGQSFFFSSEYLKMLESVCPENLELRYALIGNSDGPVAAVCMQIVRISAAQFGQLTDAPSRITEKIAQRVLVCGNLLTYGMHAVCFAPNADATIWHGVAETLYRIRRAEKLSGQPDIVLIKDIPETVKTQSALLGKLSYTAVETEPNMVLTLDPKWRTHADYLAGLTSKYRSAVKQQIFKPFDEAGCELVVLSDIREHAKTLQDLYLQVHSNADLRPFTLRPEYWTALAETAGDKLVIHGVRRQNKLIGFIATLKDGDTAFAYHIGFDRDVAQTGIPIYLRLLHASLEQAIAFGCRQVSFGRTALEPKARLGCEPEPMHVWVRHRQPMLNQFIRPLLRFIQPNDAPELNPFKKTSKPE